MAASSIDRVDHAAAIPALIAQEALGALKRYSAMAPLVNRDYDNVVARRGESVTILKRGALVAQNKTTATDLTITGPDTPDDITVTLNQHKVVAFKIEDVAKALAQPDLLAGYGQDAAIAIAEAVDDYLLALASDVSITQSVGTAGTELAKPTIIQARTLLNKARAPKGDRSMVLHPDMVASMLEDGLIVSGTTAGSVSTDIVDLRNGDLRPAFGFQFAENQGVVVTSGTPDSYANLAFHRDAIVLATRPLDAPPVGGIESSVISADGYTVRVMADYNLRSMAMEVTLDILFGATVVRPEFAVKVLA